ncbi:hypothetical protein [Nonomuraea glycinis]|uniref:hypothetical protein n=1 Tax=Nonomuraea glycinis TaxID=2047744 RepID=UPI00339F26C7
MNLLDAMNARLDRLDDDARAKLIKTMKEADLRDRHIVPMARTLRYLVYFTWNSKHSPGGFPDVVMLHPVTGALIVREIKKAGNLKKYQPRPDQQAWLDGFTLAGVDADVWTPADLFSGRIRRELLEGADRTA